MEDAWLWLGFAINATSFVFIDWLILLISFVFLNKLFLIFANRRYGNIEIFNQFKIQKKSRFAIIREANLIGEMINLHDKEGRIRETLSRLTGLEIFCRSLSFLFLIFLIIHIIINGLDNRFFIGVHFGLITTLLISIR